MQAGLKTIKRVIKEIIGFLLKYSGVSLLIREILCRNKATIVVYHDPKPEIFERHIRYLSLRYNIIPLNKLITAIYEKDWSIIPVKSLIITIDDGRKGNYELLEIFKTYNIKPTLFLCSHIVNTNRHLWWQTGCSKLENFKRLPYDLMLKLLHDQVDYKPEKEYKERQVLNKSEIIDMLPYVDFGSHTKFHPILTTCTDKECKEEIKGSKDYLEKLLGKKIKHFCYPNGNYAEREIQYLKSCSYKSARTLDIGWNDLNTDPYRLKSLYIEDDASINMLSAQVSGISGFLKFLRYTNIKDYISYFCPNNGERLTFQR